MTEPAISEQEYETMTIALALAGDAEAGWEALRLCVSGLDSRNISDELANYLAERLSDVLIGIKPSRALCIGREGGRPREQGDWQTELAALDALLTLDGVTAESRNKAMATARHMLHPELKGELDRSDAQKIRRAYAPMRRNFNRQMIEHLAGDAGKEPSRFIPQT